MLKFALILIGVLVCICILAVAYALSYHDPLEEIKPIRLEHFISDCREDFYFKENWSYCWSEYINSIPLENIVLQTELINRERIAQSNHYTMKIGLENLVFIIHYISSILIFFLVSGIVVAGVWMSWKQLEASISGPTLPGSGSETSSGSCAQQLVPGEQSGTSTQTPETTIKFFKNFEIRTGVIGLAILALSFLFYNRYLEKVYPITMEQELPNTSQQQSNNEESGQPDALAPQRLP